MAGTQLTQNASTNEQSLRRRADTECATNWRVFDFSSRPDDPLSAVKRLVVQGQCLYALLETDHYHYGSNNILYHVSAAWILQTNVKQGYLEKKIKFFLQRFRFVLKN